MPRLYVRSLLLVGLILSLGLAACTPAATPQSTRGADATAQPTSGALPYGQTPAAASQTAPTATRPAPLPTSAVTPAGTQGSAASQCTVVSGEIPTASPTQVALVPPVTASDWVEGPPSAPLTFLEYSDFQ